MILHNHSNINMSFPENFCWTRFGTEAGQSADQIFARKEQERVANGGLFFWGIGNAIGPSIAELVRVLDYPEVLFSPIRSAPRRDDAAPAVVAAWSEATTMAGELYSLSAQSLITSRLDPITPRDVHYALVCYSDRSLFGAASEGKLLFGRLRNLLTKRPVGASQVTAVVQYDRTVNETGAAYGVNLRAALVPPYFIRLRKPMPLPPPSKRDHDWERPVSLLWRQRAID
jgi:hypothetical protein